MSQPLDRQKRAMLDMMHVVSLGDPRVLSFMRKLCEEGAAQLVLEVTAEALLPVVLRTGKTPSAVEFHQAARAHYKRGCHLSRYFPAEDLGKEMLRLWQEAQRPKRLSGDVLNEALTLSALQLRDLLMQEELVEVPGEPARQKIQIDTAKLETLCRKAARLVLDAIECPEEVTEAMRRRRGQP